MIQLILDFVLQTVLLVPQKIIVTNVQNFFIFKMGNVYLLVKKNISFKIDNVLLVWVIAKNVFRLTNVMNVLLIIMEKLAQNVIKMNIVMVEINVSVVSKGVKNAMDQDFIIALSANKNL